MTEPGRVIPTTMTEETDIDITTEGIATETMIAATIIIAIATMTVEIAMMIDEDTEMKSVALIVANGTRTMAGPLAAGETTSLSGIAGHTGLLAAYPSRLSDVH